MTDTPEPARDDATQTCCAHLLVSYGTTPTGDGHAVRGHWTCNTCGASFRPEAPHPDAPAPEQYPEGWVRLDLMVSPEGEAHAIGGEQQEGEGDMPFLGLLRVQIQPRPETAEAFVDRWYGACDWSISAVTKDDRHKLVAMLQRRENERRFR